MHEEIGVITQGRFMMKILMYPYNERFLFNPLPDSEWIGLMKYRVEYLAQHGLYAEYLSDPHDYCDRYRTLPQYIKYVEEDFPRTLKMTNKEFLSYPQIDRTEWDGYMVGGRYKDDLLLKNGRHSSSARIGHIDWEEMQRRREANVRPYSQLSEKERACYKNESDYITSVSGYHTWAVLDELGWHTPPTQENNRYDISDEAAAVWEREWFEQFIRPTRKDALFTVVDIHS